MTIEEKFAELEFLGSASNYLDDILQIVDCLALFEGFRKNEIEALCSLMECFGAPTGATLIKEGDQGNFLIMVLTGSVNVIKFDNTGKKQVASIGPGAVLGELSMFGNDPRFASCITAEPTDFAVLSRQSLNKILMDMPRIGNKLLLVILHMLSARLRESNYRLLPYLTGVAL